MRAAVVAAFVCSAIQALFLRHRLGSGPFQAIPEAQAYALAGSLCMFLAPLATVLLATTAIRPGRPGALPFLLPLTAIVTPALFTVATQLLVPLPREVRSQETRHLVTLSAQLTAAGAVMLLITAQILMARSLRSGRGAGSR